MKQRTILLLAALIAASPALVAQSEPVMVSFTAKGVSIGETWSEQASYQSSVTMSVNDSYRDVSGQIPQPTTSTTITRTKSVKVTSARENDTLTGLEVTYTAATVPGVVGKTYVLAVNGNNVGSVTYGGTTTGTPGADEIAFVTADNAHFGQIRALNKTLGGKSIAVGSEVRAFDPGDLINAAEGMSVRGFVMTLTGVSGTSATFSVSMDLMGKMKKGKGANDADNPFDLSDSLEILMTGTLTVNTATCRITTLTLSGPVTKLQGRKKMAGMAGKHDQVKMDGSGSASLAVNYTY